MSAPQLPPDSAPPASPNLTPQALVGYGALFGLVMIAGALVWTALRGDPTWRAWFPAERHGRECALGAALGLVGAGAAWGLIQHIAALQHIEQLLIRTIDMRKMRYHHAVLIGLVAGIPEEILFRGALQPTFTLIPTALIFGALHGITRAYFIYATTAGLLLGGVVTWRGNLWAASTAHVVVDLLMVMLMLRSWRQHRAMLSKP